MVMDLNNIKAPGVYTTTPQNTDIQAKPVPPWEKPKVVAILSVFGGKVTQVKNITEPTIRRTNNEAFYR